MSYKYDSVDGHTQEISKSTKLHIPAVWPNALKIYWLMLSSLLDECSTHFLFLLVQHGLVLIFPYTVYTRV